MKTNAKDYVSIAQQFFTREGKFPNRRQRSVRAPGQRLRCDCAVTSAVRGGVSGLPPILAPLKKQLPRPHWTLLNWQLSGAIPLCAIKLSKHFNHIHPH